MACASSILANLCQAPYNVAFGIWWLMNPPADNPIDISLTERYFGKVPDSDKLMKPLSQIADFDVYHVLKGNIEPQLSELDAWLKLAQNKHALSLG